MTLLLFLSLLVQGCGEPPVPGDFPYRLDSASQSFQMPLELKEISGLSLSADGKVLYAVEDETGTLYLLDKKTGGVLKEIPFGKEGDYEGVEIVGEDVFTVKSNGNLYRIQNPGQDSQTVIKYDSPLGKSCDVEGLALDGPNNRLLLSCKGDSGIDHARAVFSFDLATMTFDSLPAYVIYWDSIVSYLRANPTLDRWEKLQEAFDPTQPELAFAPSAIAIHPVTGDLYMLSSAGKMLIAIHPDDNSILYIQKLKKKLHPQPEGLCFDADGAMYISNEGKEGYGMVYRFEYRN